MSIARYRQKRDFTVSPEPVGDDRVRVERAGPVATRFFCVHKHLSSRLHYDLRLEHGGVLLSWAVPKGPSVDPRDKRLARQVEDHPIEYGMFEGVIPDGYGAGIVMLWDYGTWTPAVDDVDDALEKGELKFTLDGYKLKGSWVLVRTRGWPGDRAGAHHDATAREGRSWLLIKHRDEWSGPLDITTFAPLSVKSAGDFADILAREMPAAWRTHPPVRGGATGALLAGIMKEAARRKASRGRPARRRTAHHASARKNRPADGTAAGKRMRRRS